MGLGKIVLTSIGSCKYNLNMIVRHPTSVIVRFDHGIMELHPRSLQVSTYRLWKASERLVKVLRVCIVVVNIEKAVKVISKACSQ
jgi:hypothetical protein